MEPIFVKTRTHYYLCGDSECEKTHPAGYTDLWNLVDVSGFKTVYPEEIEWDSDNTYILSPLNGEFPNPLPERKCKVIWLNIERPSWHNTHKFDRPDFNEIWVCDRRWAEETGVRYFLMGSDARLGYQLSEEYNYITNTYDVPRRTAIWSQLEEFTRAPSGWKDRDDNLAKSSVIIVPQQDDPPHCIIPLRFTVAAAFMLPMIFEGETDMYPFVDKEHFFHAKYENIVEIAKDVIADTTVTGDSTHRDRIARNLHKLLCVDTNFRKSVEAML